MMTGKLAGRNNLLAAAAFLTLVPLTSHLLFSWMGFTPTDEGFVLALSRRILDGRLPHRDFMIMRPFFSPLIHVPFVFLGGEYTFWLSRLFVWFELAAIAWLWVSIINRSMNFPFSLSGKVLVALIAFAATAHTKHITAWFTIDGLFFASIGLALSTGERQRSKLAGYFFVGLALLCKQNFILMAPVALLIIGDWRQIKYWIAAITPGLVYLIYLIIAQTLPEAFFQLSSPTGLTSIVVEHYRASWILVSAVAGYVCAWFTLGRSALPARTASKVTWLIFFAVPISGSALSLSRGTWMDSSFIPFGLLLGAMLHLLTAGSGVTTETKSMGLVLLTALSVSLSGGYTSPALASGAILAILVAVVASRFKNDLGRTLSYSLGVAALAILAGFALGRARYIYREQPAAQLSQPVGEVLRGGRMIYTNPNTYAFMSDLNRAVEFAQSTQKEFAILPDVAAYWVKAPQQDHLPAVWPHAGELSTPRLMSSFIQAMEARRNSTIFIVQKVEAVSLASGFVTLKDSDYYEVVRYARSHFLKVNETEFFELYQ